ncbi:hypothetical protein BX070DRAFT_4794 [Coemansia spiralis]|nr:hypothetical protein BX070DRAFT_4794 [Coemansia spiralis]
MVVADITLASHDQQQKQQNRHINNTSALAMPHHQHSPLARGHDYLDSAHSPVPSLTNSTSRSSSASSSVNTLSPDTLVTMPKDLLPQFKSSVGATNIVKGQKRCLSADDYAGSDGKCSEADEPHKRRRESSSSSDGVEMAMTDANPKEQEQEGETTQQIVEKEEPKVKRRIDSSSNQHHRHHTQSQKLRHKRPLTGSVDLVSKFGLYGLYKEFVLPYTGNNRQQLPDLATAYLKNVKGSVQHTNGSLDLLSLVMAPPKNEFDNLDVLPMASIKAAFSLGVRAAGTGGRSNGSDNHSSGNMSGPNKRSRISLKMSTDAQTPSPRQQQHERTAHGSEKHRDSSDRVKQQDRYSSSSGGDGSSHHHRHAPHRHQRQNSPPKAY